MLDVHLFLECDIADGELIAVLMVTLIPKSAICGAKVVTQTQRTRHRIRKF